MRSTFSRILLLWAGAIVTAPFASAQDIGQRALAQNVRSSITTEALQIHAETIVRHERPSGSPGENAAIDYVVETLRAEGIPVTVHTFDAFASDPGVTHVTVVGSGFSPEAITAAFSGTADGLRAPLVDVGTLQDLPPLDPGTGEHLALGPTTAVFPDLEGAIALVTGQPRNVPTAVLEELGAVGVIFVNPEERLNDLIVTTTWGLPSLRNSHRLNTLPVAQITLSAGTTLREMLTQGPVTIDLTVNVDTGWKEQRLAVARVFPDRPGSPEALPYVLFGGHIDGWYHAATDEGASNAAMVELARSFYSNRNQLKRGLVVAWWTGHSNGRYAGSTWFADHFFDELRNRAIAHVNIDGIGQIGAKRYGAATTSSLAGLATTVIQAATDTIIEPFRPGRNSDQSFNGIGLPLLQLYHNRLPEDGGYWWWHTPDDTYDKIDFDVLLNDTYLYADALTELLAAPYPPIDMAAEIESLLDLLEAKQRLAGRHFDLSDTEQMARSLLNMVRDLNTSDQSAEADFGLVSVDILRSVHRVMYLPLGPFHPDPGVEPGLLPGLNPITILTSESPDSDRYRFAHTTLVRENNRIMEAIETAMAKAERLLAMRT